MLKLKNISKAYDERMPVLVDVKLEVAAGESGCGKSTLSPRSKIVATQ